MDLGAATLVVGGGIGLLLALFGAKMLATGRAPASTLRRSNMAPPLATSDS